MILYCIRRLKRLKVDKLLKKRCKELHKNIIQEQYDSKQNVRELFLLFEQYSHAEVLNCLREYIELKQMIDFCSEIEFEKKELVKIKTIGVFYWRMYNGGIEKVLANCMKIWTDMGYRVVLYTDQESSDLDYKYPGSVKRIILPQTRYLGERLKKLEKSILEEKVDVFINNAWMPDTLLWELILVKSYNIPYILYTHGDFRAMYSILNDYSLKHFEVFKKADIVLTLSKLTESFYYLCGCNTKLVLNPLPQELKEMNCGNRSNANKILWIGRFDKGKRPLDAVRIFKKVNDEIKNAELEMVGVGELELIEATKQLVKRLDLENKVYFRGYQEVVNNFYQEASIMLMTSEMEGYPTVLLESKAYGIPCVMYELPCSSLIQNGKGILSAPIGAEETLAGHIIALLQNSSKRHELGKAARESFEYLKSYDFINMWKEIFGEIENYEEVFHSSENVRNVDESVLPLFAKHLERANEQTKLRVIEYKIGNKVLEIPRIIKKMIFRRR